MLRTQPGNGGGNGPSRFGGFGDSGPEASIVGSRRIVGRGTKVGFLKLQFRAGNVY